MITTHGHYNLLRSQCAMRALNLEQTIFQFAQLFHSNTFKHGWLKRCRKRFQVSDNIRFFHEALWLWPRIWKVG